MEYKSTIMLGAALLIIYVMTFTQALNLPDTSIGLERYISNLTSTAEEVTTFEELNTLRTLVETNVDTNMTLSLTTERANLRTALYLRFDNLSSSALLEVATTNAWKTFTNNTASVPAGLLYMATVVRKQTCFIMQNVQANNDLANALLAFTDVITERTPRSATKILPKIGSEFKGAASCMQVYFATRAENFTLSATNITIVGVSNTTTTLGNRYINVTGFGAVKLPNVTDSYGVSFVTVTFSPLNVIETSFSRNTSTPSVVVQFYGPNGVEINPKLLSGGKLIVTFNRTTEAFNRDNKYTCIVENRDFNNWDSDHCETVYQGATGITCSCDRVAAVSTFSAPPAANLFWLIPVLTAALLILIVSAIAIVLLGVVIHFSNNPTDRSLAMEPITELKNKFSIKKKKEATKAPSTRTEDAV